MLFVAFPLSLFLSFNYLLSENSSLSPSPVYLPHSFCSVSVSFLLPTATFSMERNPNPLLHFLKIIRFSFPNAAGTVCLFAFYLFLLGSFFFTVIFHKRKLLRYPFSFTPCFQTVYMTFTLIYFRRPRIYFIVFIPPKEIPTLHDDFFRKLCPSAVF